MSVRIGQGFDVHAFDEGDHVMLGGVAIPHSHGLKAHSDGDVALHALSDALLGALALGDIGHHFPDTDPQWRGADSGQLLTAIYSSILDAGWRLGNADLTVIVRRQNWHHTFSPCANGLRRCCNANKDRFLLKRPPRKNWASSAARKVSRCRP